MRRETRDGEVRGGRRCDDAACEVSREGMRMRRDGKIVQEGGREKRGWRRCDDAACEASREGVWMRRDVDEKGCGQMTMTSCALGVGSSSLPAGSATESMMLNRPVGENSPI